MVGRSFVGRIALLIGLGLALPLSAEPTITNLTPRGLQIGGTTTVVIDGKDLAADQKLLLPFPGAKQTVKPGATATRVEIEVTLDDSVQPGIHPARVVSSKGVSNQVALGLDRLKQVPFAPELEGPAALHGNLGGGQILKTAFTATRGSTWVFDVEAQRLGSGVKPVIRIHDQRGTQIAWSAPQRRLDGDARAVHTFAADGKYTLELHEPLFRGANPPFFRLKVGPLQYADLALPLGIAAGGKSPVQFLAGNLSAAAEQDATALVGSTYRPATLPPGSEQFSGPTPTLMISDHPELVENKPSEGQSLQALTPAPIAVSGTISAAGEEDVFTMPVTEGQRLNVEVFAQRLGSPLDGVLAIRNAQGNQLAASDDRPGTTDPGLDFNVPAGVNQLLLAIKDLKGAGGDDFVYRIAVKDLSKPDFTITLSADHISIPAGGTAVVPFTVTRQSYNGPIDIAIEGLPPEVQLAGNRVSAGASMGLLTFTASGSSFHSGNVSVVARAVEANPVVTRLATFGDVPGSRAQPYLKQSFAYAVAEAAPISLAWTPQADKLFKSTKVPVNVRIDRKEGASGSVRLRLVSSQPMPTKTVKENNQDKTVDDPNRALRLDAEAVLKSDQPEANVNVVVPGDLPSQSWDLTFVAELLAADNKTVVASVAAPARSFVVDAPFSLELTSDREAQGRAGAGDAGKFTGKIHRAPGFDGPVAVALEGLPKGVSSPTTFVGAGKSEFELPLVFPFATKPANFKDLKLVAISAPSGQRSPRSAPALVNVKVVAGEKPNVEPPREVFEDDEQFAALLTEGGGQATVVAGQKYSGEKSLRVSPDQKLNPKLPNLGVNIRENPGPGEYRYLQFAWRKQGGSSICLQLNHDGAWGPASGGRPEASFRYHAGPGPECFGASVQVSDELPGQFVLVTRDLYADFGEFTLTGLAFSPVDAQQAFYDHIYLARTPQEFDLAPPKN
jgi:hypothetical protein